MPAIDLLVHGLDHPGPDGSLDVFSERLPHFPNGCAVTREVDV